MVSEVAIRVNPPRLLFLLLDLDATDLISDLLLKSRYLLRHTLVEDHYVGEEVQFHLGSLPLQLFHRLAYRFYFGLSLGISLKLVSVLRCARVGYLFRLQLGGESVLALNSRFLCF